MEKVGAVSLEVQALARSIGSQQYAERVARGVCIESALDLFAAGAGGQAVDNLYAFIGTIGALDRLLQYGF